MSSVLLVDDSPADRALFRTILTRAGYDVHELAYGAQAGEKARELRPHVVILDVNLPDAHGHEVCRNLREDKRLAGLPVLMLTVRHNDEDILAGLQAGADDYVAKDSPAEIFLARIRRLVDYRRMSMQSVLNEQLVQIGRLLAGIVHEIRSPLSVIRGNAELMRMHYGTDHEIDRWVDPIVRNSRVLQVRLEHLMAAVRTGPPEMRPTDAALLISEAADLFLKGIDESGVRVEIKCEPCPGLPAVTADPGRILQVLLNLVANAHEALAAAKRDGSVRMAAEVEALDDGPGWVRITVEDNGPGIPPAVLGRLFEPFFTTKPTGSGYGLYLAYEIVREHGGSLEVENRPEGGARFTIRLRPEGVPAAAPGAQ